jgi:DNA adenine methylase
LNYSPLRYPGGKSKLAPLIYLIMQNTGNDCRTYIEPFVGGAGVALSLLLENRVDKIVINDYDKAIYSFWRAIKENTALLLGLVANAPLTIEEWRRQKEIYTKQNQKYSVELGFAAFYLNRTNRSGVLNGGPIGGVSQDGNYLMDARYNREELINRIERIAKRKKDIYVYNKEVRSFISNVLPRHQQQAFIYFDPPYYKKGHELYKNFFKPDDHEDIANSITQSVRCDWIVTYDDVPQIETLYQQYTMRKMVLRYSVANTSSTGSEIIVFKSAQYCPGSPQLEAGKIKINIV